MLKFFRLLRVSMAFLGLGVMSLANVAATAAPRYAANVLMPAMDQKALAEIKSLEAKGRFDDPRYDQLLMSNFYTDHILRMPQDQWPDPVVRAFNKINTHPVHRRPLRHHGACANRNGLIQFVLDVNAGRF